jgi:hypothetical protein
VENKHENQQGFLRLRSNFVDFQKTFEERFRKHPCFSPIYEGINFIWYCHPRERRSAAAGTILTQNYFIKKGVDTVKQVVNKTMAWTARDNAEQEPIKLLKRVGSTTFVVSVRFSGKSTETLEDKVLRLIEREVEERA